MREIYKTDAIILSGLPYRDDGKIFLVLSPSLGLCFVKAIGIRSLKSRLRYVLQDLSLVELDLVKGRVGWKITNANLKKNWFRVLRPEKTFLQTTSQIKNLLFRMTDNDADLGEVFSIFNETFDFYTKLSFEEKNDTTVLGLELLVLSKILYSLGYVDFEKWPKEILVEGEIDHALLQQVFKNKSFIIREINRAINESQL